MALVRKIIFARRLHMALKLLARLVVIRKRLTDMTFPLSKVVRQVARSFRRFVGTEPADLSRPRDQESLARMFRSAGQKERLERGTTLGATSPGSASFAFGGEAQTRVVGFPSRETGQLVQSLRLITLKSAKTYRVNWLSRF